MAYNGRDLATWPVAIRRSRYKFSGSPLYGDDEHDVDIVYTLFLEKLIFRPN